jgi:hypothetical protein
MKYTILFTAACLLAVFAPAQSVAINTDGSLPDNSAVLDVKHTSKGVLLPRLSQAQRNQIVNPATGLLVYQTDNQPGFYYYNGSSWALVGANSNGAKRLWDFTYPAGLTSVTAEIPANAYATYSQFVYRGTTVDGPITSVTALIGAGSIAGGGPQYQYRIYDVTNSKVIAESIVSNIAGDRVLLSINTISNLPAGTAVFAIQIRCVNAAGGCAGFANVQVFQ